MTLPAANVKEVEYKWTWYWSKLDMMKEAQGALADRSQMLISSHIHQLKRRHPPCLPHYQASKAAQLIFKNNSIWHSHLSRLWLCMRISNITLPSQSAECKQRAQRLSLRVRCWSFFVIAANRHQINLTFVRKRVTVCFFIRSEPLSIQIDSSSI